MNQEEQELLKIGSKLMEIEKVGKNPFSPFPYDVKKEALELLYEIGGEIDPELK